MHFLTILTFLFAIKLKCNLISSKSEYVFHKYDLVLSELQKKKKKKKKLLENITMTLQKCFTKHTWYISRERKYSLKVHVFLLFRGGSINTYMHIYIHTYVHTKIFVQKPKLRDCLMLHHALGRTKAYENGTGLRGHYIP